MASLAAVIIVETAGAADAPSASDTLLGAASPPSPSAPIPAPPRVAVIGDSLIVQTLTEQAAALQGRGFDPVIYGRAGVPLSDAWMQGHLAAVAEDRAVTTVVLATASNDNLEAAGRASMVGPTAAVAEYRARLEAAIAQLADRCVVVVDVRSTSTSIYAPELAPRTNVAIAEVAASRPRRVVEVDWDAMSRSHQADWFISDALHFDDIPSRGNRHQAGADAYAAAIAEGVARCAAESGTPPGT